MLEHAVNFVFAVRTWPLDEGLAPVIEAILVLGSLAIGFGVCIARALTRSAARDSAFTVCRRHDWLHVEDGYVCVRCNYRAGS